MALSDHKLWDLWNAQVTDDMSWTDSLTFARAIEAEVRKDDEALMRQMLEALDDGEEHTAQCKNHWYAGCDCTKAAALTAARARLKS